MSPSIFFVSLPKSGTVYTWYSLEATTGLRVPRFHELEGWADYNEGRDFSCPDLYACGDYNTQLLLPAGMRKFLHGYVFGSHMQASYHNMRILKESGISRITVLLRDPRDAFVSWVHHLRKLGPSARNYHSKIYHIPRDYYEWSLSRQFQYQVRTFLPITANWVEGWLDYYASPDREVDVQFVYFDELRCNPARYIQRIADFHRIEHVDLTKVVLAEPGKMHFRKGKHGEWREEFCPEDLVLADNLMGTRILDGFKAAAGMHPSIELARRSADQGDFRAAASEAVKVLMDFPSYRPAYDIVVLAAESSKIDASDLSRLLQSELGDLDVASSFLCREELLDRCKRLANALGG